MPRKHWATQEGLYPDDWDVEEHPFPDEIASFIDCITRGEESPLSFARAAKAYHLIFAIEESARTGQPVRFTRN